MATMTASAPHHTVLFSVPFRAEMTPHVKRLLEAELNLTMHWERKVASALQAPGVARLDSGSGLYLLPGETDEDWILECRTFGRPPAQAAHRWRVDVDDVVSRIADAR